MSDIKQLAKEIRELIDYGCRDSEVAEYIHNWQAARASEGEQYPDCDTCGKSMDYMPWHYSKGDQRHLHACDECWPKVNFIAGVVPEGLSTDLSARINKVSARSLDGSVVMSCDEWNDIVGLVDSVLSAAPTAPVEEEPVFWWDGDMSELSYAFEPKQTANHTIPLYEHPGSKSIQRLEDQIVTKDNYIGFLHAQARELKAKATHPHNGEQGG